MHYLAALDYDHLDNGVFLTSLARSLAEQQKNKKIQPIIVHTDSAYTERIIQSGVMRDEASIRSLKGLNKRLVALFADQGVSTIGINPYKKNFITLKDDKLTLDQSFLQQLSDRPVLLLSTLVQDTQNNRPTAISLPRMTRFLHDQLGTDEIFIFLKSDKTEIFTDTDLPKKMQWKNMEPDFKENQIPDEFKDFSVSVRVTSARDFNQFPASENTILIE